jgi:hypothetical protein
MQDQLATQVHLVKSVPRAKLATPARIGHLSVPAVSLAALPVASATQDLLVMTVHLVVTLAIVKQDQLVTLVPAMTARHVVTSATATQDQHAMTVHLVVTSTIVPHAATLVHAMTARLAATLATATHAVTTALLATIHVNAALTMQEARPQTRRLSSKTRF